MNLSNLLPETSRVARELQEMFRCLKCKCLPSEPYFTGICDHLLCLDCLSKSNECPICSAQYFKKESHLNRMIKEGILYVSDIVKMTSDFNETVDLSVNIITDDDDDSLPDLKLGTKGDKTTKYDNVFKKLMPPPPQPMPLQSMVNKSNQDLQPKSSEKKQPKKRISKPQQTNKIRSQSVNVRLDQLEESQRPSASAIPRSQSVKRVKKNNKGETPVHLAVMNADSDELIRLLQDPTTDVNAKDNAGWTALHEACNKGNLEMVKLLLEHNADVNSFGYQKNTPLHEAIINENYDCAKYLIEIKNADQTIRNEFGILARDIAKNIKDKNYINLFNQSAGDNLMASQRGENLVENNLSSQQSQFDLNASCLIGKENRRNSKNKAQKKIVILGTGMSNEDKEKLNLLATKLNLQIAKELKNNVTHIIFSTGVLCTRTITYMKAILMGIWIVSIKWLEDSVEKGFMEQENNYEAEGSQKIPTSKGPFKGRFNASCQYPKLFEDCYFFLSGEFKVFEKKDFANLLELGGATILKREPKLERIDELITEDLPHHLYSKNDPDFACSYFILYDATKTKEIRHKYLNTVRPSWLFSSIDEFKLLKPQL